LPDVDPGQTDPNASAATPPWEYGQSNLATANYPKTVANVTAGVFNGEPANANAATEETATVEGLININTAPWRVLAAVPWLPPGYTNRALDNANIAMSIVYYRDVYDGPPGTSGFHAHGPFKSIFELGNVPIYSPIPGSDLPRLALPTNLFRNLFVTIPPNPNVTPADQGDLTAIPSYQGAPPPPPVVGDFKSQYMMINRVSNLITTRSDSFTAYILLQGWRNAETPGATLAVQRRVGLLIDRSGVTPINPSPAVNLVPNQ
jgi:hypothetical protein